MKHLKTYKIFENIKNNSELIIQLESYSIENYTINKDGTIDIDGDVDLSHKGLTKIPFNFGKVTGDFFCDNNQLINLEGCPKEVVRNFNCGNNKLTNLIGGPQEVGSSYYCSNNPLETLEGCAGDIGIDLFCRETKLTSLDCASVIIGDIECQGNVFEEEPDFFGICEGEIIWK